MIYKVACVKISKARATPLENNLTGKNIERKIPLNNRHVPNQLFFSALKQELLGVAQGNIQCWLLDGEEELTISGWMPASTKQQN